MSTNVQELKGNWRKGWAIDLHTISSVPLGDNQFDTTRTEVGELLYQVKYQQDVSRIEELVNIICDFMKTRLVTPYLAAILPVPPSDTTRPFQPVQLLAERVGDRLKIPVLVDYLIKNKSTQALKNLEDAESRKRELGGVFSVKDKSLCDKKVLLFDDLYRSGETLTEITDVLYNQGKVQNVYVLTITKTRVNR